MEYLDQAYQNILGNYANTARRLNMCKEPYEALKIGEFNKDVIDKLLSSVYSLVSGYEDGLRKELLDSGIKNKDLQNSQMADPVESFRKKLKPLEMARGRISGSLESEAFEINKGEVSINKAWESDLLERYTTRPSTANQKKFAKLVEDFERIFIELDKLLPKQIPIIKSKIGDPGLFTIEHGNRNIKHVNIELLRKV